MRKASQDGADATSIKSGIENEIKKSVAGIVKIKRNSIKRKVQNLSNESDDGVGEPLLQKEKEKVEGLSQSAKFLLSKTKTDNKNEKEKYLPDDKTKAFSSIGDSEAKDTKDNNKNYGFGTGTVHNHMNTNVFANSDSIKNVIVPKSQILVELDSTKLNSYNSGPLIFTTAKIHTDGINKNMEPVQVTPVPILSTVEGSVIKTSSLGDVEHKITNNIASGEIKKTDTGLSTVFENNSKATPKASAYSTLVPSSNSVGVNKTFEQFATIQPVSNKTNATVCSTVLNEVPKQLKTESNHKPEISSITLKNEVKGPQSAAYEAKRLSTSHGNNIAILSKVDVNKNFESSSNETKQSENVKSVLCGKDLNQALQDTSAKIDDSLSKQLHRQKTIEDPREITKPLTKTCSSEPIRTQTTTVISHVKAAAEVKPSTSIASNVVTKSIANMSDTPTTFIAMITPVSTLISTTKQSHVSASTTKSTSITSSTTPNSISTRNIKPKSTAATSSNTVNVMTFASQIKPSIASEQQKPIAKSGVAKNAIAQVGKNLTLPIKSLKSPDESAEISNKTTSGSHCEDNAKVKSSLISAPSVKSSVPPKSTEKRITTNKPNTPVTKSIDIVTTSSKSSINSKPVPTAPSANTVKLDSLKSQPSNIVSSTGSTDHTTSRKAGSTVPLVVSEANTSKTMSSESVTPASSKLPQSTVETRGAMAGKPASILSKTTKSSSNSSSSVTTPKLAQLPSSTKLNNTLTSLAVGVKSSKTIESPSAPKPSTTHNQNQLENSETKKEKLK